MEDTNFVRKISLSYLKDSIVKKTGARSPKCSSTLHLNSQGCCCSREIATNGDLQLCHPSSSDAVIWESGSSTGLLPVEKKKQKVGILKSLKKKFQLGDNSTNVCSCECGVCSSVRNHSNKVSERTTTCKKHGLSVRPYTQDHSGIHGFAAACTCSCCCSTKSMKSGPGSVCPMPSPRHFSRNLSADFAPFSEMNTTANTSSRSPALDYLNSSENLVGIDVQGTSDTGQGLGMTCSSAVPILVMRRSDSGLQGTDPVTISVPSAKECVNLEKSIDGKASEEVGNGHCREGPTCEVCTSTLHVQPTSNINDNSSPAKFHSLSCELLKLSHFGWYWGPISRSEAEKKLVDQSDGVFLVRDSSADRYLLSVSFRSFGKTLHTRIEYNCGLFSFYANPEQEGYSTIVELINHAMSYSETGLFCYTRPRNSGYPAFPVRLTKPMSRFTHVRSLQYLCRFVIRQYTRLDNIQKLPLPNRLKGYIEERHY